MEDKEKYLEQGVEKDISDEEYMRIYHDYLDLVEGLGEEDLRKIFDYESYDEHDVKESPNKNNERRGR